MTMQMTFEKADIEKNRKLCGLGYFIFFIPLLIKDSPFSRFHANQTLVLVLVNAIGAAIELILFMTLPTVGFLLYSIWPIFIVILMIYGCVNAVKGHAKKLPLIGNITLLKNSSYTGPGQAVTHAPAANTATAGGSLNGGTDGQMITCPKCGMQVDRHKKFCGHCGEKIEIKERLCAECGAVVPEGFNFCGSCGTKYVEPEPKERKCPNCGRILEEKEKFCMECGTATDLAS